MESGVPYRVFLAIDLTEAESAKRIPFYEDIGRLCNKFGCPCYLPYRYFGIGPSKRPRIYEIQKMQEEIFKPQVELVIAYLDIESHDVGVMVAHAAQYMKDLVFLYNKKNKDRVKKFLNGGVFKVLRERTLHSYVCTTKKIEFETDEEALSLLEREIKRFFN